MWRLWVTFRDRSFVFSYGDDNYVPWWAQPHFLVFLLILASKILAA